MTKLQQAEAYALKRWREEKEIDHFNTGHEPDVPFKPYIDLEFCTQLPITDKKKYYGELAFILTEDESFRNGPPYSSWIWELLVDASITNRLIAYMDSKQ